MSFAHMLIFAGLVLITAQSVLMGYPGGPFGFAKNCEVPDKAWKHNFTKWNYWISIALLAAGFIMTYAGGGNQQYYQQY